MVFVGHQGVFGVSHFDDAEFSVQFAGFVEVGVHEDDAVGYEFFYA